MRPPAASTPEEQIRTVPFGRPWIDGADRRAVAEALESPILTHGPQSVAFEEEFAAFLGGGGCVTVSSCAAALHLAYAHFGIGPGDEVIVPAQTHVATANTAEWTAADCVFVDCEPATGNVTPEAVRDAITPRTKAIAVVHFAGIPCDVAAIVRVAREHGLVVIEDCALAVGARVDAGHVGLHGDAGCFSFYPIKHITTGEGGMFVARDREVAEAVARLRAHGVDRRHDERAVPGMYDVPSIGLNYRLSELQAALGRSQLRRIDEILARRRANFEAIADALRRVDGVRVLDGPGSSWYCLSVVLEGELAAQRDDLIAQLRADGVGTSIYYPQPVPAMSYYQAKYGYDEGRYPNAVEISAASVALPVGPHVSPADAAYVAERVRAALERF